jgi:hemerythrin-like metal-binding protein
MDDSTLVEWEPKYSVGVELIDGQHQKLFRLVNNLHRACVNDDAIKENFSDALHTAVDYVVKHFGAEEKFLAALGYPELEAHRKMHVEFSKTVLESAKSVSEGKTLFAAFEFVRFLKDWILGHILVNDMGWSAWVKNNRPEYYHPPVKKDNTI